MQQTFGQSSVVKVVKNILRLFAVLFHNLSALWANILKVVYLVALE